jgi:hypothetical protein
MKTVTQFEDIKFFNHNLQICYRWSPISFDYGDLVARDTDQN